MRYVFIVFFLITFSSIALCSEYENQITHLVKKMTKEESLRISIEKNVSALTEMVNLIRAKVIQLEIV